MNDTHTQTTSMSSDVFDDPIKLLQWLSDNDGAATSEGVFDWTPTRSSKIDTDDSFDARGSSAASSLKTIRSGKEDDRSIDCLADLRPAIRQRLKQNGIRTVGHLRSLTNSEILRLPGFGEKKAKEIREALRALDKSGRIPAATKSAAASKADYLNPGDELSILSAEGLSYIDNRAKNGALWVIGGEEISPVLRRLKSLGMTFHFKKDGSQATKGKPAWWTRNGSSSPSVSTESIIKGRIPVHSKRTGETTISLDEIVCIRPYGKSTAIDTRDSWYVCNARPMQFTSCLEAGAFAFLNNSYGFSGAVRKQCVSKVSANADGSFSVYIEVADATIQSSGKPLGWHIENFGSEKVFDLNGLPVSEQNASIESSDNDLDVYSVSSPELVGLLFGLVCDGIINLREAKMLRKWLDSAAIQEEGAIRIRELLDKVLDDNIISPEEEQQMLDIFNRIIELDGNFSTD